MGAEWIAPSEPATGGALYGIARPKWAKLARCWQDTAYRDILDLLERGALQKDPGGGRSTSYSLAAA